MLHNATCSGCLSTADAAICSVHLIASPDIGAWREVCPDGTLGALRGRSTRGDACCFRCGARRADILVRRRAGQAFEGGRSDQYSIELRSDAESLALPGVAAIDIEIREPTARLTLNAVDITIASVTADDNVERADVALVAGRALEVIAISADLKARALPAIDA